VLVRHQGPQEQAPEERSPTPVVAGVKTILRGTASQPRPLRRSMWVMSADRAFAEKEENDPTGCTMWEIFAGRKTQVMLLVQGERISGICPQIIDSEGCRTQAPTRREQLALAVTRLRITDVGLVINEAWDHLHSQRSGSDLVFAHLRWELRCQSRPPRNVE
jgi:hypothetical protein